MRTEMYRLVLATLAGVAAAVPDWLIHNINVAPTFVKNADGTHTLSNGLVSRTFTFSPSFGTVEYYSHTAQSSLLRAIDCEGYITLDKTTYALGGIVQTGQYYHAYLNRSATGIQANDEGWNATSWSLSTPVAPFPWTPGTRGSPKTAQWPPVGLQLSVVLQAPATAIPSHKAVTVTLVYEMYPNIPLLTKWITVNSTGPAASGVVINDSIPETLRLARQYSPFNLGSLSPATAGVFTAPPAQLYVQTDEAHGTLVNWLDDGAEPADPGAVEAVLQTNYSTGPGVILSGGSSRALLHNTLVGQTLAEFVSFRTFELCADTYDPERMGMSIKRLYRLWAPHSQENPIFFHATDSSDAGFKIEIDQMVATGFEMLIYSFGSGFNLETADPVYLAQVKAQIAYANSNGIEVGGYDLICLDRGNGGYGGNVGDQWDRLAHDGATLLEDACFASGWYDKLNAYAYDFINETGLIMLETDGPYGGGDCASTNHTYHLQLSDSVYQQTRVQAQWYAGMRERNVYINQPDYYFFQGGQRTGMGYNEDQYSLPRWQDVTVSRMTVYDDTYAKLPTMGWMFVPLVDYHGGGDGAAFEPMSQHLPEYNMAIAQYMMAGVAACYRGFRLYDAPSALAVVSSWVRIYKEYRDIIISDIVHIRRPDGQSIDAFMHANAFLPVNKGFVVMFNPTLFTLTQVLTVPLYYTGITTNAFLSQEGAAGVHYTLARDYSVAVNITMGPQSVTWFVVTSAD